MFLRFQNWLSDFDLLACYTGIYPLQIFRSDMRNTFTYSVNSSRYRLYFIFSSFFAVCVQGRQQQWLKFSFQSRATKSIGTWKCFALFCYWWNWIKIINSDFSSILIRTNFYYLLTIRDRIWLRSPLSFVLCPLYFVRLSKSFYF